jgi:hypothetical protein
VGFFKWLGRFLQSRPELPSGHGSPGALKELAEKFGLTGIEGWN